MHLSAFWGVQHCACSMAAFIRAPEARSADPAQDSTQSGLQTPSSLTTPALSGGAW